ncbi:MAG: Na+/H+ antiporter NhaA [Alphaproteobacteria bacterium]|nr:Na+/H+ antiporter NhaA [Alphaproteobacteria bacterium]
MAADHAGATAWWRKDTTPGTILIVAAIGSFLLLNGPAATAWQAFLKAPVQVFVPGYSLDSYVRGMVKDALMAVFFLYVGLELKRECIEGPFRNLRQAALPALGAAGGMIAPALIYLAVATHLHPEGSPDFVRGWAIPAATDIAFAVGVLSLLGNRVPLGLRLFLLALAIADDLGAILVVAIFFSNPPALWPLATAAALFAAMIILNIRGVKSLTPYWVLGVLLWFAMAKTGISPTLAGVLTAVALPMFGPNGTKPLVAAEHALKPWVQLGIMPIFALVMAGVPLAGVDMSVLTHPVALGIAAGLVVGKPLGIVALSYLGASLLKQSLPCRFGSMLGVSMVAGIGFTMSLFVGALAFYGDPALEAPIRLGVLGGSVISAVLGLIVLAIFLPRRQETPRRPDLARMEDKAEDAGVLEDNDAKTAQGP